MQKGYKAVKGLVYSNPLLLTAYRGTNLEKYVNSLIPYGFALEIETQLIEFNETNPELYINQFRSLLYKLELDDYLVYHGGVEHGTNEIQIRFPKGINGLIGLFSVLEYLKTYSYFNLSSGIHLHIDFSDYHANLVNINKKYLTKLVSKPDTRLRDITVMRNIYFNSFFERPTYEGIYEKQINYNYLWASPGTRFSQVLHNSKTERIVNLRKKLTTFHKYLLSQLDFLDYKGTYNRRDVGIGKVHVWLNFRGSPETAEIRIINMTYDYSKLVSQIIFCQDLMRKAKHFYTRMYIEVLTNKEVTEKVKILLLPSDQQSSHKNISMHSLMDASPF